jgi:chromosome segregation ATPase
MNETYDFNMLRDVLLRDALLRERDLSAALTDALAHASMLASENNGLKARVDALEAQLRQREVEYNKLERAAKMYLATMQDNDKTIKALKSRIDESEAHAHKLTEDLEQISEHSEHREGYLAGLIFARDVVDDDRGHDDICEEIERVKTSGKT